MRKIAIGVFVIVAGSLSASLLKNLVGVEIVGDELSTAVVKSFYMIWGILIWNSIS